RGVDHLGSYLQSPRLHGLLDLLRRGGLGRRGEGGDRKQDARNDGLLQKPLPFGPSCSAMRSGTRRGTLFPGNAARLQGYLVAESSNVASVILQKSAKNCSEPRIDNASGYPQG